MGIFDRWLGKEEKMGRNQKKEEKEFGGYKTKAKKEAWACAMVGNNYALQGRYADAIGICDKGLKKNPKCKEAWLVKGVALGLTARYEEAMECADKAIMLDPNYEEAWLQKGSIIVQNLSDKKAIQEAIRCYEKVLSINPYVEDAVEQKEKLLQLLQLGENF